MVFNLSLEKWEECHREYFDGDPGDHDKYLESLLVEGGYSIRRTNEGFELDVVGQQEVDNLSKRIEMIERYIKTKYPVLEARARALMEKEDTEFEHAFKDVLESQ